MRGRDLAFGAGAVLLALPALLYGPSTLAWPLPLVFPALAALAVAGWLRWMPLAQAASVLALAAAIGLFFVAGLSFLPGALLLAAATLAGRLTPRRSAALVAVLVPALALPGAWLLAAGLAPCPAGPPAPGPTSCGGQGLATLGSSGLVSLLVLAPAATAFAVRMAALGASARWSLPLAPMLVLLQPPILEAGGGVLTFWFATLLGPLLLWRGGALPRLPRLRFAVRSQPDLR